MGVSREKIHQPISPKFYHKIWGIKNLSSLNLSEIYLNTEFDIKKGHSALAVTQETKIAPLRTLKQPAAKPM
jgi:hypothetical protein